MTTEQRLDALESAVFKQEVPTNDRQKTYDITGKDGCGKILVVRRITDDEYFGIGDLVRYGKRECVIEWFIESATCLYVTLIDDYEQKTVPLADITRTEPMASHNWAAKHGVNEWEITAFRSTKIHPHRAGEIVRVPHDDNIEHWFKDKLSVTSGHWEIYEVRAGGTTWKLGDEVVNETGGMGEITGFKIQHGVMVVNSDAYFTWSLLNRLKRPSVKEWEIVEFRSVDTGEHFTMYLNNDKNGYCNLPLSAEEGASLLTMLLNVKDGNHTIHSVRRLSDNELFTVGDKIDYQDGMYKDRGGCPINYFTLDKGQIYINKHGVGDPELCIKDWIKCEEKKPLFVTADGISMFEGQKYWYQYISDGKLIDKFEERIADTMDPDWYSEHSWRHFSTRATAEAAYDKWLCKQPVLTLLDLDFSGFTGHQRDLLKELVKDKLSKK